MATPTPTKSNRVKTKRDGASSRPIAHEMVPATHAVSERLNAAVEAGWIEGTGGRLPEPRHRPVNHGKSLSDMIVEDRG